MLAKRKVAWGTGVGVVLTAASGALINELQAGWPWWVASATVVLASAALASWIAAGGQPADDGKQEGFSSVRVGPTGFFSGRNMRILGKVKTAGNGGPVPIAPRPAPGEGGKTLDVRGFYAGKDMTIKGDIDTTGGDGKQ